MYKIIFPCFGGRHHSAMTNITGDITSEDRKNLIGLSSQSNRNNSVTVSDNTIAAEVLGDFPNYLGNLGNLFLQASSYLNEKNVQMSKNMRKHNLENHGEALEVEEITTEKPWGAALDVIKV